MSSEQQESTAKNLFESRFMSFVLMIALIAMAVMFIIAIWILFGREDALVVMLYIGIGLGIGIIVTILSLIIVKYTSIKSGRNLILGFVVITMIVSLIISLILNGIFGSWAFIKASSIGLGITTGIALSYIILAIFQSSLVKKTNSTTKESEMKVESH